MNAVIRIGIVQSVNIDERTARVYFSDTKIMSGHLKVVRTDDITTAWMPRVNDVVICLYPAAFNADGFIIGGI